MTVDLNGVNIQEKKEEVLIDVEFREKEEAADEGLVPSGTGI